MGVVTGETVHKRRFVGDCKGFSLPEALIVIAILGIVLAVAVPSWLGVVESRRVNSAANQLAADLRLAHTKASNQLTPYQVKFTNGSSTYQIGPAGSLQTRTLEDGVKITTQLTTVEFSSSGSATGPTGAANEIVVSKTSPPTAPQRGISINPATSRIKVG